MIDVCHHCAGVVRRWRDLAFTSKLVWDRGLREEVGAMVPVHRSCRELVELRGQRLGAARPSVVCQVRTLEQLELELLERDAT